MKNLDKKILKIFPTSEDKRNFYNYCEKYVLDKWEDSFEYYSDVNIEIMNIYLKTGLIDIKVKYLLSNKRSIGPAWFVSKHKTYSLEINDTLDKIQKYLALEAKSKIQQEEKIKINKTDYMPTNQKRYIEKLCKCSECHGTGYINTYRYSEHYGGDVSTGGHSCYSCNGSGKVLRKIEINENECDYRCNTCSKRSTCKR